MWTKNIPESELLYKNVFNHSPLKLEQISRRKTKRFFASFTVSAWPKSLLHFDFKNHENVSTDL